MKLTLSGRYLITEGVPVILLQSAWWLKEEFTDEVCFNGIHRTENPHGFESGLSAHNLVISWREKCD